MTAPPPEPALELADDHRKAGPRQFVYLDQRGRVLSRRAVRLRRVRLLAAATLAAAMLVLAARFWLGPRAYLGLGLVALLGLLRGRAESRINRAAVLVAYRRYREAEAVLASIKRPFRMLALVAMNRAAIAEAEGDHARQLAEHREAERIFTAVAPRLAPHRALNRCAEVICLVHLGRLAEARVALGQPPEGDYLRLQWWTAELYLAMAENHHTLDAAALAARTEAALAVATASGLLGVLAWAHHRSGDDARAWQLLRAAEERRDRSVPRTLRLLTAFTERHAASAGLSVPYR
ncbi:MAG: hypothetical protein IT370_23965 [Deltaproteobacteria bacterium]|nr:hypothetical protein [Deltaproteobacteria bacterium]